MLHIAAGAPPPVFAEIWDRPHGSWGGPTISPPLGVACNASSGFQLTFLMNDPLRRAATLLLERCPLMPVVSPRFKQPYNASCLPWAVNVLRFIFDNDMVLEDSMALFTGTVSASNANVRALLGPRVYFLGLRRVDSTHLLAAQRLLESFALVAPVAALDSAGVEALIAARLGWPQARLTTSAYYRYLNPSMKKMHSLLSPYRPLLIGHPEIAADLRRHNEMDTRLYQYVERRFASDLAAVGAVPETAAAASTFDSPRPAPPSDRLRK